MKTTIQHLAKRMDQISNASSSVKVCDVCGIQGHAPTECSQLMGSMPMENANALYNNQLKPHQNPYPNTFNEGYKNHPYLSYKSTNVLNPPPQNINPSGSQRLFFNPQQQYNHQPPPLKSQHEANLEALLANKNKISADNTTSMKQLQAQNKMLENQVVQFAQQMSAMKNKGVVFQAPREES